jgi:hypothetical protein
VKVEGVGKLLPWGEFWLLQYDPCGHDFYFFRNGWNYADEHVLAEVQRYYPTCDRCGYRQQKSLSSP